MDIPTQNQIVSPAKQTPRRVILILCGIALFGMGLFGGYMMGVQQIKNAVTPNAVNTTTQVPITTPTQIIQKPLISPTSITPSSPPVMKQILIPSDWKSYTATDPAFGVTATISLPPGYSFFFTGSEFTIQNSEATEMWDYTTSVFNGNDGLKNYYDGGSRRVWYQKYISGDTFGNFAKSDAKITNVDESNSAYLKITVATSGIPNQISYIAVKNGIINIFRYGNNQNLAQYMPQIIASLSVTKIK
jgi:hypothetical protein